MTTTATLINPGVIVEYNGDKGKVTKLNGSKRCYIKFSDGTEKRVNNKDVTVVGTASKPKAKRTKKYEYVLSTNEIEYEKGLCLCGCGSPPQGKRSAFAQGHDQRLRGLLANCMRDHKGALKTWNGMPKKLRNTIVEWVEGHSGSWAGTPS